MVTMRTTTSVVRRRISTSWRRFFGGGGGGGAKGGSGYHNNSSNNNNNITMKIDNSRIIVVGKKIVIHDRTVMMRSCSSSSSSSISNGNSSSSGGVSSLMNDRRRSVLLSLQQQRQQQNMKPTTAIQQAQHATACSRRSTTTNYYTTRLFSSNSCSYSSSSTSPTTSSSSSSSSSTTTTRDDTDVGTARIDDNGNDRKQLLYEFLANDVGIVVDDDDSGDVAEGEGEKCDDTIIIGSSNNYNHNYNAVAVYDRIIKTIQDIHGMKQDDEMTVQYLESAVGRDALRELADSIIQQQHRRTTGRMKAATEEYKIQNAETDSATADCSTTTVVVDANAASNKRKKTRRTKWPIPSLPVRLHLPKTKSSQGNNSISNRDKDGNSHRQDPIVQSHSHSESMLGGGGTTTSLLAPEEDIIVVDWRVGEKLMAAIKRYDENLIEATCGGQVSCSTCHVYLLRKKKNERGKEKTNDQSLLGQQQETTYREKEYEDDVIIDMIPPPDQNELDMIDLAWQEPDLDEERMISRLSCQIRLMPGMIDAATASGTVSAADGVTSLALEVQIPNDSHDLWDG